MTPEICAILACCAIVLTIHYLSGLVVRSPDELDDLEITQTTDQFDGGPH